MLILARQARTEIDDALRDGLISRPITFKESQGLVYLQACIKEGLRLHPATGLPLARVVPKEGAMLSGIHFPAGVRPPSSPTVPDFQKPHREQFRTD
jgi:cytochrome P450